MAQSYSRRVVSRLIGAMPVGGGGRIRRLWRQVVVARWGSAGAAGSALGGAAGALGAAGSGTAGSARGGATGNPGGFAGAAGSQPVVIKCSLKRVGEGSASSSAVLGFGALLAALGGAFARRAHANAIAADSEPLGMRGLPFRRTCTRSPKRHERRGTRQLQAPLKARYKQDPQAALVTLRALGRVGPKQRHLRARIGQTGDPSRALHPAAGG